MSEIKKNKVIKWVVQGKPTEWIQRHEDISARTIRRWLLDYAISGKNADILEARPLARSQPLTAEQVKWVYHVITNKCPRDLGLEKLLWNSQLLGKAIRQWIKKDYRFNAGSLLLADLGIRYVNMIKFNMTPEVQEICSEAKQVGAQILYLDQFNLKSSFKIHPKANRQGGAAIVQKKGAPTKNFILYSYNQTKRGNKFLAVRNKPNDISAIDFLERLKHDFPALVYAFVSKDSCFFSEKVFEHASKNISQIKLFVLPS